MKEDRNYCILVNTGACTARPWAPGDAERGFHESLLEGAEDLTLEEAQEVAEEWIRWCEGIAEERAE